MKETSDMKLLAKMKTGKVYRRKDLEKHSSSVDLNLKKLCVSGEVSKLAPGLYCKKDQSRFGSLPPEDKELIRAFLEGSPFLLMSFNHYNSLGLGLTQLRGDTLVYNRKRHAKVKLGTRYFIFKRVPEFPQQCSKEFLLVDLLNNLKKIGESSDLVLENLEKKKDEFDPKKVRFMSSKFGKISTKKYLKKLYG